MKEMRSEILHRALQQENFVKQAMEKMSNNYKSAVKLNEQNCMLFNASAISLKKSAVQSGSKLIELVPTEKSS